MIRKIKIAAYTLSNAKSEVNDVSGRERFYA